MTEDRGPSDDAVRAATGRDWREWEEILDAHGAAKLSHREIVALVGESGVENGWWRQQVATTYEKRKGKRVLGQMAGGFEVGVRRTVPVRHDEVWRLLTSPEGVRAWLGDVGGLRLVKGERYEAGDGATGEVRVIHPDSHLRITRRPAGWERPSTIQVRVLPSGGKTAISFHEENLPGPAERQERRAHFEAALEALQQRLAP